MIILTDEEYENAVNNGAGVSWFMGGFSSKNGNEILVVGDTYYLFLQDEVMGEDWKVISDKQTEEARVWCDNQINKQ